MKKTLPIYLKLKQFHPLVWVFFIGFFFSRAAMIMVWPFVAIILKRNYEISAAVIGLVIGSGLFFGCFIGFYAGYFSDRFGRKKIVLLAIAIFCLSFIGLAISQSIWLFLFFTILTGIAGALFESPARALILDLIDFKDLRELSINILYFCINLGAACGPLAAILFGITAKTEAFYVAALIYFIFFLILLFMFRKIYSKDSIDQSIELPNLINTVSVVSRDRSFLYFILALILCFISYSQIQSNLILHIDRIGLESGLNFFALLIAVNSITVMLTQFPLIKILRKYPIQHVIRLGMSLMGIGFISFGFLSIEKPIFWVIAMIVLATGEVIAIPNSQIHIDRIAAPNLKGTYFGAAGFSKMGNAFGPFLGGLVFDFWTGSELFVATGIVCLFSILVFSLSYHLQGSNDPLTQKTLESDVL